MSDDKLDGFRDTQFETDMQVQKVKLGIDAERFMESMLGQYLLGRADIMRDDAIRKLIDADPEDAKTNRELRNEIVIAERFSKWLTDAIESGRAAEVQIRMEDASEE